MKSDTKKKKGISEYQLNAHKRKTAMSEGTRNLNKYTGQLYDEAGDDLKKARNTQFLSLDKHSS
jgi:hypothetical protein